MLFISTLMFVGSSFAATDPPKRKALSGWGPWKFGMTLDAAAKAAGDSVKRYGQAVTYSVTIEKEEYTAGALALGDTEQITTIVLNPSAAKSISRLQDCVSLFDRLAGGLAKRYGKPNNVSLASERKREALFDFLDGGKISLTTEAGFDGKGQDDCTASISFQKSPAKKLDSTTF